MKIDKRYFPHPVLSEFSNDYVDSYFDAELKCTPDQSSFNFSVSFQLKDEGLKKLIDSGDAWYLIHLECAKTNWRIAKKTTDEYLEFSVPAGDIHYKVEGYAMIVAAIDIEGYSNKNFHKDFERASFFIQKGDILAVGSRIVVNIEKEPVKNIESIFQVTKSNENDALPMTFDCEGNKIVLILSPENYSRYNLLKRDPKLQAVFHSLLVVPALCTVIEDIKARHQEDDLDSLSNYAWFRSIDKKLSEIGKDIEDPNSLDPTFETVQELIEFPLTRAFQALEEYLNDESEDDE
jgi:hypothetical protein